MRQKHAEILPIKILKAEYHIIKFRIPYFTVLFTKKQLEMYSQTHTVVGEISGSHGGEYEDGCLLGCCAV
jgi:hypothetical protein